VVQITGWGGTYPSTSRGQSLGTYLQRWPI